MPGPVSSSFDPEFGTTANAEAVRGTVEKLRNKVSKAIGSNVLQEIDALVGGGDSGPRMLLKLTERELRILRFALNRALESL